MQKWTTSSLIDFVLKKKKKNSYFENLCYFYESSENLTFSRPRALSQQIEENAAWNVP